MLSRRGNLEQLNLKDNKPVPADDDRPYRMWYPTVVPRRILGKQIVVCEPNRQAVVDIKWSKILPHKGISEEVKVCHIIEKLLYLFCLFLFSHRKSEV
ncbi:hypothetical protein NECAME_09647 [Necator americanus]|uniref:Uncharacterized protein n=1 Tax=Necator americanus TaxID=51031 RepID=W2TCM3_NECAM|nr:hypothetical protein NECAME_09647 [Necator americanus]ETN79780.1 hypothetical protein NECAME_09647 [Necator americanus]